MWQLKIETEFGNLYFPANLLEEDVDLKLNGNLETIVSQVYFENYCMDYFLEYYNAWKIIWNHIKMVQDDAYLEYVSQGNLLRCIKLLGLFFRMSSFDKEITDKKVVLDWRYSGYEIQELDLL